MILIFCFRYFDLNYDNESYFAIRQLYRQPRYTDKIQTKAYTLDDLVGAVGGYVGLFLGYAFVQFPQLLRSIFYFIKRNKT